ncbi:MAG: type IV pilus assembly protein PilM [Patescibacteria group bacterium]
MPKVCIGLDIGTSAVKAIQLSRMGESYTLTRAGVVPIPLGAIEGGTVRDTATVAQLVTRLLRQARIGGRRVMVAVAGQGVLIRSQKFPPMTRKELAGAIRWEAEKYIPFPIDEAVLDFDVVGATPDTGEQEVMIVAAQRSIIDSHIEVLKEAKLQALAMDVQPFALARSLGSHLSTAMEGQAANVALIDVGAGTTDLVIFREEVLRFTRIIPIGGNYFTRALAGRLGMSDEDAEALKLSRGQIPLGDEQHGLDTPEDAQLSSILAGVMSELVTEIRRSIDYFRLQTHEEVARLVATGGGIMLRNMVPFLERELGLPVETGDPMANIHAGARNFSPELMAGAGPIFCVAIGLALRGVQE